MPTVFGCRAVVSTEAFQVDRANLKAQAGSAVADPMEPGLTWTPLLSKVECCLAKSELVRERPQHERMYKSRCRAFRDNSDTILTNWYTSLNVIQSWYLHLRQR